MEPRPQTDKLSLLIAASKFVDFLPEGVPLSEGKMLVNDAIQALALMKHTADASLMDSTTQSSSKDTT